MRERTKTVVSLPGYTAQMMCDYLVDNGNPPWTVNVPLTELQECGPSIESQSISDIVTPGFKKIQASGGIVNNPVSMSSLLRLEPQASPLSYVLGRMDGDNEKGWNAYGKVVPFGLWDNRPLLLLVENFPEVAELRARLIQQAVTKAYANVDEAAILAGATLAEGSKTMQSLTNITQRSIRIAKELKRLDLLMAAREWTALSKDYRLRKAQLLRRELSLKKIQEDYMACRYAIRPLVYDANGVIDVLKSKTSPLSVRKTARGKVASEVSYEEIAHSVPYFHNIIVDVKKVAKVAISVEAGILYDGNQTYASLTGMSKLPETLLELLPFSFILDWVCNLSETVAAHSPEAGVNQLASWVTVREKWTRTNSLESGSLTPDTQTAWTTASCSVGPFVYGEIQSRIERTPDPSLRTWPMLRNNLSMFKLLDLGIILRQLLQSK